mmetsp:Transcript_9165/g.18926  ORF Transcript_9165/g.18926 Transcript_9165/m.18926 type:complete len:422 (-) Transcript_9165:8-1273(-)
MTSNNDKNNTDNDESEMPFGLSVHNHESPPKHESEDLPSNEEKRNTTKSYGTIDDDPETGESSQQESPPETDSTPAPPVPLYQRIWQQWCKFYNKNSFLVLVVCAILIAYAYPPLGAEYLRPDITATWIAVLFIFVLAGMGIKTEEFAKAFQRLYFNVFLQVFNFGVVSGIVYGFSRFMVYVNALAQSLADGMTICASLPITVNMVLVLTKSAGGDEASAIFNAAFGNLVGVFLSPALILGYLGVKGEINLGDVFVKLGLRVILPIAVGQFLQKFVSPATEFVKKYKKYFKTAQEYSLVFIIYTVFCKTFKNGSDASVGDVFLMIALQFLILGFVMVLAWFSLRMLFRKEPTLQAMGLFGCTHKTVAMGVPLINAIYEDNPLVGMYTLPLLIWHPMQLVLGTAVAPHVAAYVKTKQELSDI